MAESETLRLDSDGNAIFFEWHEAYPGHLEIQVEGVVPQDECDTYAVIKLKLTRAQTKQLLYWLEVTI